MRIVDSFGTAEGGDLATLARFSYQFFLAVPGAISLPPGSAHPTRIRGHRQLFLDPASRQPPVQQFEQRRQQRPAHQRGPGDHDRTGRGVGTSLQPLLACLSRSGRLVAIVGQPLRQRHRRGLLLPSRTSWTCCPPGPPCRASPCLEDHLQGVLSCGSRQGPWLFNIVVAVVLYGPARPPRAIPEGPPPAEAFCSPAGGSWLLNVVLVLLGLGRLAWPIPAVTASADIQEAESIYRGRVSGSISTSAATAGRANHLTADVQPIPRDRIADGSSACATGAEPFPGRHQVFFPVPQPLRSTEGGGCPHEYGSASWTGCVHFLMRHLERDHRSRIEETLFTCSRCGENLSTRPPRPSDVPGAAPVPAVHSILFHGRGPA
ncbi:hypothetical protein HPB50_008253 [Hyalomma asiaticum]|uniref:Uncharacterized protein n=1 Tax=Hyalomma asiaticum TaxID=266040 RepID=A0ACB7T8L2_HYAAI|nr:hypothetical protein HPB50_008253 [Hyalomma asiaticum]